MKKRLLNHLIALFLTNTLVVFCNHHLHAQDPCNPDTIPPVLNCLVRVNVEIPNPQGRNVYIKDFLESYVDNCTSLNDLTFSFDPVLRKDSIFIGDTLLAPKVVHVYVTDESGNKNSCQLTLTHSPCGTTLLRCKNSIQVNFPLGGNKVIIPDDIILPRACPLKDYEFGNGLSILTLDANTQFPFIFSLKDKKDESLCSGIIYYCGPNYTDPVLECASPAFPKNLKGGELRIPAIDFIKNISAFCKIDSVKILIQDATPECIQDYKNQFLPEAIFCCEDEESLFDYILKIWTPVGIQTCTSTFFVDRYCSGILTLGPYFDIDRDCRFTLSDIYGKDLWFKAEGLGKNYYSISGNYGLQFKLPFGNYSVSPLLPIEENKFCNQRDYDLLPEWNGFNASYALLTNKVTKGNCAEPSIRFSFGPYDCNSIPITFHYKNNGTSTLVNAYVEIQMDPIVNILSLSERYIILPNKRIRVDLGNLNPNQSGTFIGMFERDCDSPIRYVCFEAFIFPEIDCLYKNIGSTYIVANSSCSTDSAFFTLTNRTDIDMQEEKSVSIIEDDIIIFMKQYKLNGQQSVSFGVPLKGKYYNLVSDLVSTFPVYNKPNSHLINCNYDSIQIIDINKTQYSAFGNQLNSYFDCIGNPYDPNMKVANPIGFGNEHKISKDDVVEYKIHFQNVGTAPAKNVVIKDIIDQNLDLFSIYNLASSHEYNVILDSGTREVKFVFNNINLPDSTTDYLGSHGFVSFLVQPISNVKIPTIIKNSAAIYFDQNSLVLTDTVFHTIDTNFIEVVVSTDHKIRDGIEIKAYPNPITNTLRIEVKNYFGAYEIKIYNLEGRQVGQKKKLKAESGIEFNLSEFLPGVYFYRIIDSDKFTNLASGKLIKK
ncbi:MAG: T9SS type A sorting domain-containing protein [Saprospiraceae bacterium]|nr:T9SS type A sorting domain-containing protein [Saprospiraceae bacterium]